MNRSNDWSRPSSKDTLANAGVILAGVLAVMFAALSAFESGAPIASQDAYRQNAQVQTAAVAGRVGQAS